jgi:hypothetical protein
MKSKNFQGWARSALGSVAFVILSACGGGGGGSSDSGSSAPTAPTLSAAAVAGEALFHDPSLSASGRQSCATCHVPTRAFTADPATDHGLPVPLGGPNMDQTGFRNAPSLMCSLYLLGYVSAHHVVRWWRGGLRRLSGGSFAAILAVLTVGGFALFFVSDDQWQRVLVETHDVLGIAITAFALQHWLFRRRPKLRKGD